MNEQTTAFLEDVDRIQWFARVRRPLEGSATRVLADWTEWPGPSDPLVEAIHVRQQEIHDALLAEFEHPEEAEQEFQRVVNRVIQIAGGAVPFDEKADAWHAPTSAVWHAAWTAGLVALYQLAGRSPERDIAEQWQWFLGGRWPAAAASLDNKNVPVGFVVM
jgi:hypothetical protein